jgi:hypothetical protein
VTDVPGIDDVVDLLSADWARHGVTDGFRFEGAGAEVGSIEVAFRWRLDPQRYLVRFEYPGWLVDALGPGFDAASAVGELALWLMEELDTGYVGRAERRRVGDAVLLLPRPHRPSGWFVGRVPLAFSPAASRRAVEEAARTGRETVVTASPEEPDEPVADPGRFLDLAGLDGSAGRAAAADGTLIAWLQIDRGEVGSPRSGQAVVVRLDADTAGIVRLDLLTPDPRALEALALTACRVAVEGGARTLVADRGLRELLRFGFMDDGERLIARHDGIRPPAEG